MSKPFNIKPGNYDIPNIGKVNAFQPVSDEKLLAIYRLKRGVFPWISTNENTLPFLKKQKLLVKDVAKLVQNAQTTDEVKMLLQLTDSPNVERIAETKLKGFEENKPNA
ncbi:hypothetical protein [Aequorivita echinoideorum]|uniref:Uncharacterized protein n=1 Tax=Aequorivita echinoideorum TaxID=1549647 RepID=A0ABS5S5E1_9FLAO|nr:hypothetical protein [Aequorivita echinoideorum]MBT0607635.1 hypothetical protein [Aequorivita echinoideorum]